MSYLPGKFVWFEHASTNVAKARAFYEPLLGWHTELMPVGEHRYPMILNRNQGIGGFTTVEPGDPTRWMAYLSVPDVDAAHAAAVAAGARSLAGPMDFGPVGRGAEVADPTGARLWLWKSADGDRADEASTPAGDWYWTELWTPDVPRALDFYQRVAGYTHDTMDMGPQGTYHLLKKGDAMRGGLMQSVDPQAAPLWLPYVAVDDCDASTAKAKKLGAQVLSGPEDVPGIGRFSILADPLGAAIALMQPAPMQA